MAPLPQRIMPTDLSRVADPVGCLDRLGGGNAVILRDRDHPGRPDWAARLRAETARRGQLLLIANDAGLARAVGADGLHLSEGDVGQLAPWGFTTAAAHSLSALRRAERAGVDAVVLSPVFATDSHPGATALGLQRARAIAVAARVAVYALGGMDARRAGLLGPSFAGWAAISAFARFQQFGELRQTFR